MRSNICSVNVATVVNKNAVRKIELVCAISGFQFKGSVIFAFFGQQKDWLLNGCSVDKLVVGVKRAKTVRFIEWTKRALG